MSEPRQGHHVVKTPVPHPLMPVLRAAAAAQGISMAEFSSQAVKDALRVASAPAAPSGIPKGPSVLSDAVEAAARVSPGVPRHILEAAVAATICSLDHASRAQTPR